MKITLEQAIKQSLIGRIEVLLNGIIQNECIMADEENGVVEVYQKDLYKNGMSEIPTEFIYGKVEIIFKN